jgi:hypothetical protein
MKTQLLLADLVALIEIVDEHVDRTFPGVGPPASLRKLRTKLIHMTRMYSEVQDGPSGRSRPVADKPGRDRSPGKSNRGKPARKTRPQSQTSR